MGSFQDKLIETMIKDFKDIQDFEKGKILRKECSLLLKRIQSTRKLISSNTKLIYQLDKLEAEVLALKS